MKLDFTQLNELGKEKITHKLVKSQASKTLDYKKEHIFTPLKLIFFYTIIRLRFITVIVYRFTLVK